MDDPAHARLIRRLEIGALALAALIGLTVIWAFRFRGWYPHDEGVLGQAAERVLRGQIPHRDFDDPYSGGLALLHATVFRMSGISMNALRNHMALVASIWFGGIFWLLTRWLRPFGAAAVAAVIVVLSVPLYPAAMPSWYVLFLACAAGAALVMGPRRGYSAAFVAGGLIGIAALAKVSAVFALAGAMWALVVLRQDEDRTRRGAVEVLVAAVLFCGMVIELVSSSLNGRVLVNIALPPLALVLGVAWRELNQGRAHGFGIDVELWRRIAALVAGAAIPVLVYMAWLSRNDALTPFVASLHGVVGRRAASARLPPPSVRSILYAIPLAAILLGGDRRLRIRPLFLAASGLVLLGLAWDRHDVYAAIFDSLRGLLPVGAVLFCLAWQRGLSAPSSVARRVVMVFVPLAGMMVLTQFPFAAPIYFVYVLPLLIVGIAAVVSLRPKATQLSAGVVAVLYTLFSLFEVIPGAPETVGLSASHFPAFSWLHTRRGQLLVSPDDMTKYGQLLEILDSLPPGPIWGGPDAPEVAFLSGRPDLNGSFFGFLGPTRTDRPEFVSQLIASGARIVVVDTEPSFSAPLSREETAPIIRAFPNRIEVDIFQIHWRGVER
jgi:hypothetical protein